MHRDRDLSQRAITLALEALDYATQPWYDLPDAGARVRQEAARILGQLDPLYRDERIFARLVRVLQEDADADVRDAAYGALLRLAAAPEERSQDMETDLAVEMVQGGSMLLDTPETLLLRVIYHGHYNLPTVDITILESAEYTWKVRILCSCPALSPGPREVTFRIRAKVTRRMATQLQSQWSVARSHLSISTLFVIIPMFMAIPLAWMRRSLADSGNSKTLSRL